MSQGQLIQERARASIPMSAVSMAARSSFLDRHRHPDVLTPRDCYVCGRHDFEALSSHDRYGIPYPTGVCRTCGNVQQTAYYPPEVLADFYQNFYRDIYGARTPSALFDVQVQRKIFDYFDGSVRPEDHVLELGTGAGGNLLRFRQHGCAVLGLDFDERYLEEGRRHGLEMQWGSLDELRNGDRFDIVIIAHVLEHIDGPSAFLRRIGAILAEGGRVYIEVPSLNQVAEGGYDYDLATYFQNAHTIHFTLNSLRNVCLAGGFEITKCDSFIRAIAQRDWEPAATVAPRVKYDNGDMAALLATIRARKNNPYLRLRRRARLLISIIAARTVLKRVLRKMLRRGR